MTLGGAPMPAVAKAPNYTEGGQAGMPLPRYRNASVGYFDWGMPTPARLQRAETAMLRGCDAADLSHVAARGAPLLGCGPAITDRNWSVSSPQKAITRSSWGLTYCRGAVSSLMVLGRSLTMARPQPRRERNPPLCTDLDLDLAGLQQMPTRVIAFRQVRKCLHLPT
jgi:hypothetical protein